ncbi:hypothetical protein ACHAXR_005919 [Thalassiosira sp. AJA248-18]
MGKGGDAGNGAIPIAAATVATETTNNDKIIDTTTTKSASIHRPWYIRGGMHVNEVGMGLNVTVPPIYLAVTAATASLHSSYTPVQIFAAVFLLQVILAAAEGMRTVFCVIAVPCYLTSFMIIPGTLPTSIAPTLVLAIAIAIWRVGACMSVCLHRYAAHAAFKCGPGTRLFLNVMGCMANQGGPIWWASQHRCHHKHCDVPRDPHSAIQDGVENAFAFFSTGHAAVEEEFAPKHNDTWLLRLLDTWSFAVCSVEMLVAYHCFGREGLFVSYTSMWICQTITLWFNIANHPPNTHPGKDCQATNFRGKPTGWYPAFWFLDALYPYFGSIVSEKNHEDHHVHFMLAKREKYDCMYHLVVWPLEKMGLVWDVKVAPPE